MVVSQQNLLTTDILLDKFKAMEPFNFSDINLNSSFPIKNVPTFVKRQIEAVLFGAKDTKFKLRASEFTKRFVEAYSIMLNHRAFGFQSLVELLDSLSDLVYVELTNTFTNSQNEGDHYEVGLVLNEYPFRKYGNVADISEDLTKEGKIRSKRLVFFGVNGGDELDQRVVHLFDADDRIYIHWTQVAKLFGLKLVPFLAILKGETTCKKSFKLNENNGVLFDLVEKKLGIDLNETNESDEIHFVVYDRLRALSDFIMEENTSWSRKIRVLITKLWTR